MTNADLEERIEPAGELVFEATRPAQSELNLAGEDDRHLQRDVGIEAIHHRHTERSPKVHPKVREENCADRCAKVLVLQPTAYLKANVAAGSERIQRSADVRERTRRVARATPVGTGSRLLL